MKDTMHLTEHQWQLLSAYLDGELSDKEQAQVAALLASHPRAADALQALRNLKSLLRTLPVRSVPHNYILTRQEAMAAHPGWLVKGLRVLSGVSAAALTALLAIDLFLPMRAAPQPAMLESMAAEEAPLESAAPLAQEAPEMESMPTADDAIEMESMAAADEEAPLEPFYFEPAPVARGMGGGGGSPYDEPGGLPGIVLPDISITLGESYPPESAMGLSAEEELTEGADMAAPKSGMDTGPILGVAPPERRGDIIEQPIPRALPQDIIAEPVRLPAYLAIEIALLALSLVSALAAIILHRRRRASH